MNKEEKKAINKELQEEQLRMEKEFHKTPFGKFMRVLLILTIIAMIIGFIIGFAGYAMELEQPIRDFASNCVKYGGISSFFCMMVYCIFVPEIMGNKEEK